MDREVILKLAKDSGAWEFFECHESNEGDVDHLIAFANAIAAHEREEIAKFCEENQVVTWLARDVGQIDFMAFDKSTMGRHEGMAYASAIRSRGNK